jgi:hypothetical protein
MKMRIAALAALLTIATASASAAAVIGLQVVKDEDGIPTVASVPGGFLSLWTVTNREAVNPGAGAVTITGEADFLAGFTEGAGSITGFFNGPNPLNAGAAEFSALNYSILIADNVRLENALWIRWTGGRLIYQNPNGVEETVNAAVVSVIPAPAALPLLLGALGALGFAARRRKAA